MSPIELDALVVGAGFGGIYQLYSLKKLGLLVKAIERAPAVGGVWHWNRYPGVMTDSESYLYRYSWDKEDLQTYPWSSSYLPGADVSAYLQHVVNKHGLQEHIMLSTCMISAEWQEGSRRWLVQTDGDDNFLATYLFTALGIQSTPNVPDFPGLDTFAGLVMHTSAWDASVSVAGRRVGVVGCGSSGIQTSNAIAPIVASLSCFIRSPQFSIPLRPRLVTPEMRASINARYDSIWAAARASNTAFGFDEPATSALQVDAEERQRVFERLWEEGNGFRFMFGGFGDLCSNEKANGYACEFLRSKIARLVKDPIKASVLTPWELFARRPACDQGYFERFNQDNVFAVDIRSTPIRSIEPGGIRTADGKLHGLDVIVLATGFQSGDGSYRALRGGIKGRGGVCLSEHLATGPKTYLSMFVPSFPNLFLVNGPQGPFSNAPTLIEVEVEFLTGLVAHLTDPIQANSVVECTTEAELAWVNLCADFADSHTLFGKVDSWLSTNSDGSKVTAKFFYGGLDIFRAKLQSVKEAGYSGLRFF